LLDQKIDAKEIYFKDLFGPKFLFQIPGYQRQFSWERDNFDELFDDISQAFENSEENYFLGSIILQTIKHNSDESGIYDVVDGQQRLTTLTILLAVMRDLSTNEQAKKTLQDKIYQAANPFENTPEKVRLLIRERERDFFKKYILEVDGTNKKIQSDQLNEPQTKMVTAVNTFKDKFYNDNKLNDTLLNSMIMYILNNCIFVYVKTGSFTSAYRLFSILNDRGLPLTTADLLKSSNLGAINNSEKDRYQKLWEKIEEDLGQEEFDKILGLIRTIFVKEKAKKSIIDEYEDIIFKQKKICKGSDFIKYLDNISDIYRDRILNAELSNNTSEYYVKYYNLMALMRDYITSSDWIPVFLSFAQKFPSDQNQFEFLLKLEKKFMINLIKELTPTARIIEMMKILQLIENKSTAEEIIKSPIFETTSYENELVNYLSSPEFYKKKHSKYILMRLDMGLSENTNIIKAYWGVVSIEHVLPQTPEANSPWTAAFTDQQRKEWTHRLGNLVLLSRKKNSSANNKPFDQKIKKYFSQGITEFALTKELTKYPTWDIHTLETRQNELISKLRKIWIN
jgi:uncharacterized protein with ParB-like and HNH nuclease domain